MEGSRFHWVDYLVFACAVTLSASVGIFYGWKDRKRKSVEEYLMAGRKMHFVPICASLYVSWTSAISLLGDPVEVYYHGMVYFVLVLGYMFAMPAIAHIIVPVYYNMRLTSAYQMVYLGIALYAPAVALSLVSGMETWEAILISGCVCTFYTALGGTKAVLWADTLQMFIMLAGLIVTLAIGSNKVGGIGVVWQTAKESGRLNISFSANPFVRSTFWAYLIGGFFRVFNPYSGEQYFIQRYCTARSLRHAKLAVYGNMLFYFLFPVIFALLGLLMVTFFKDCDPLTSGAISQPDQLLPLLVLRVLRFLPGLSGLFLACVYSAALSTLSSGQNSVSTMCLHDVIMPLYKKITNDHISELASMRLAKLICVCIGVINVIMAFIVLSSADQAVFQFTTKITGMFLAPIFAVFVGGILFPSISTIGVTLGAACCLCLLAWLGIGSMIYPPPKSSLPTSTSGCALNNISFTGDIPFLLQNVTDATISDTTSERDSLLVFNLSPMLYTGIGPVFTIAFSALFTFIVNRCNRHRKKTTVLYSSEEEKTHSTDETSAATKLEPLANSRDST